MVLKPPRRTTKPDDWNKTMTTEIKILAIDDLVEECMTILVCGNVMKCFVNYCPSIVAVGETYLVDITIDYSEPLQIEKSVDTNVVPEKIGNGFSYYLHGILEGETFRSFIDFPDDDIHYDYPELVGKPVKIEADRININFIS